jgi:tRNA-Thr(GGU) m(6)t(6)A37 methyltransferase TsaA
VVDALSVALKKLYISQLNCRCGDSSMPQKGELKFVGTVESAGEEEANVRISPEFRDALNGINEFSHVIVLYWIHLRDNRKDRNVLQVVPRGRTKGVRVGVFACRSPSRPNPIGLCVVRLLRVEDCTLTVKGLDAFEGSPVIDIKPYIQRSDAVPYTYTPEWVSH